MAASTCNGIAPTVLLASSWGGSDGNWSTFPISVGTPGQNFSVLPYLTGGTTWVPVPEGCNNSISCAATRGVGLFNGQQSPGFLSNESSTWQQLGLYELFSQQFLYGSDENGLYGLDTVALGGNDGFRIQDTAVAGIATTDFWLGSLGLSLLTPVFTNRTNKVSSLLSSMKDLKLTPSCSYGFSAGASYRQSEGSLIFGGYDQAQFASDTITYTIRNANDTSLAVDLQGIVVTNTLNGTLAFPMPSGGLQLALDSSTAQLWLPETFCNIFASVFGLFYDDATGLYLTNSTNRQRLINLGPRLTFTLASDDGSTADITFNYSAFDQMIGIPVYDQDTFYFPIRQTVNETQFVLGRTFLQEAYLAVDWERGNFTIGQNSHEGNVPRNLVTICPPPKSSKLSSGAIAGIVVGGVMGLTLLGLAMWFAWSRWQKKKKATAKSSNISISELEDSKVVKSEIMSNPIHELADPDPQLASTPIFELAGSPTQVELPGSVKRPY